MIVIYSLLSIYLLWVFYLAVMNLHRVHKTTGLSKMTYTFGVPVLAVGLLLDVLVNIIVCSIVFFDIPRELTVTDRLQRYVAKDGWRKKIAEYIAKHFLDVFDPSGKHI